MTAFRYPETPEDRRREHDAADATREAWRCGVWVRPADGSRIDWELFGPITAQAEFKTRRFTFGYWPDVLACFADKWDALLAVPRAFIVIQFDDGLRWAPVGPESVARIDTGGRQDRPGYIRPCAYLRNDALLPIERRPLWLT